MGLNIILSLLIEIVDPFLFHTGLTLYFKFLKHLLNKISDLSNSSLISLRSNLTNTTEGEYKKTNNNYI